MRFQVGPSHIHLPEELDESRPNVVQRVGWHFLGIALGPIDEMEVKNGLQNLVETKQRLALLLVGLILSTFRTFGEHLNTHDMVVQKRVCLGVLTLHHEFEAGRRALAGQDVCRVAFASTLIAVRLHQNVRLLIQKSENQVLTALDRHAVNGERHKHEAQPPRVLAVLDDRRHKSAQYLFSYL